MPNNTSPIDNDLEAIAREAAACFEEARGKPFAATEIRTGKGGRSEVLDLARAVAYHTKCTLLERAYAIEVREQGEA